MQMCNFEKSIYEILSIVRKHDNIHSISYRKVVGAGGNVPFIPKG